MVYRSEKRERSRERTMYRSYRAGWFFLRGLIVLHWTATFIEVWMEISQICDQQFWEISQKVRSIRESQVIWESHEWLIDIWWLNHLWLIAPATAQLSQYWGKNVSSNHQIHCASLRNWGERWTFGRNDVICQSFLQQLLGVVFEGENGVNVGEHIHRDRTRRSVTISFVCPNDTKQLGWFWFRGFSRRWDIEDYWGII
jgi:hypothetical protein